MFRRAAAWTVFLLLAALAVGCASSGRHAKAGDRQRGVASWYGEKFHGRPTASGEIYDMYGLTAAHRELPLGTLVDVENLDNGRRVRVKVNDRGPFIRGRILDLSYGAAQKLGMVEAGLARVEIQVVERGQGKRAASSYVVQVGSFRERSNADALVARLGGRFPEVSVRQVEGFHRVQVGALTSSSEAEELRRELRAAGFEGFVVGLP